MGHDTTWLAVTKRIKRCWRCSEVSLKTHSFFRTKVSFKISSGVTLTNITTQVQTATVTPPPSPRPPNMKSQVINMRYECDITGFAELSIRNVPSDNCKDGGDCKNIFITVCYLNSKGHHYYSYYSSGVIVKIVILFIISLF